MKSRYYVILALVLIILGVSLGAGLEVFISGSSRQVTATEFSTIPTTTTDTKIIPATTTETIVSGQLAITEEILRETVVSQVEYIQGTCTGFGPIYAYTTFSTTTFLVSLINGSTYSGSLAIKSSTTITSSSVSTTVATVTGGNQVTTYTTTSGSTTIVTSSCNALTG
ncbi:MAG: hypothetical protein ACYCPW_04920 [Nitrososphaerales archaeon]